jgi:hypothetical protein
MIFGVTRTVMDPAWFFSSLAQATAALVGFVGGFSFYRLHGYIAEWTAAARELGTQQRRWPAARRDVRREDARRVDDPSEGPRGRTHAELLADNLWGDVRRHVDAQDSTHFPPSWAGSASAWPRSSWWDAWSRSCGWARRRTSSSPGSCSPVTIVVVAIGVFMHHRARADFLAWKSVPRLDEVEAALAREHEGD